MARAVNARCRDYDNAGEPKLKRYGYGVVFAISAVVKSPLFIGIFVIGNLTNTLIRT